MLAIRSHSRFLLAALFLLSSCGGEESRPEADRQESDPSPNTGVERTFQDLGNAALDGRLDVVREAVGQGVDPDGTDQLGRTPLMFASYNGHTDIVRFLIREGADVLKQDDKGMTPLMFAASGPFPDTVELLLDRGAELNITDLGAGWTALMFAAAEGNREVVSILLDAGVDISIEDADGDSALDFARDNGHTEVENLLENHL